MLSLLTHAPLSSLVLLALSSSAAAAATGLAPSDLEKRATTCSSSQFQYAGSCVSSCPTRMYGDASARKCTWCTDSDARKCTRTKALECSLKYLNNGACVAAASCPEGTWADITTHTCSPCSKKDPLAATCNGWRSLTCKTGHLAVDPATTCVATCPARSYLDASKNKCVKCKDQDASVCSTAGAQKCTFRYLYEGSCLKTCSDGFYPGWSQRQCLPCTGKFANSLTCSSTAPTTCSGDLIVVNGACVAPEPTVPTCSPSQYLNANDNVCVDCSTFDPDAATCTNAGVSSCATLSLRNGQCLAACKSDEYLSTKLQTCVRCSELDSDAATCDEATGVKTCATLSLVNGHCAAPCGEFEFYDPTAQECKSCGTLDGGAKTCTATKILTCYGSYQAIGLTCGTPFSLYTHLQFPTDGRGIGSGASTDASSCARARGGNRSFVFGGYNAGRCYTIDISVADAGLVATTEEFTTILAGRCSATAASVPIESRSQCVEIGVKQDQK